MKSSWVSFLTLGVQIKGYTYLNKLSPKSCRFVSPFDDYKTQVSQTEVIVDGATCCDDRDAPRINVFSRKEVFLFNDLKTKV